MFFRLTEARSCDTGGPAIVMTRFAPAAGSVALRDAELRPSLQSYGLDLARSDFDAITRLILDEAAVRRYLSKCREKEPAPEAFSAIYIIAPEKAAFTKVGRARNPVRRLSELQTGCWEPLSIKGMLWTTHEGACLEGFFHHRSRQLGHTVSGEWTNLAAPDAVKLLLGCARAQRYPVCPPIMFLNKWMPEYLEWELSNPLEAIQFLPKTDKRLNRGPRIDKYWSHQNDD